MDFLVLDSEELQVGFGRSSIEFSLAVFFTTSTVDVHRGSTRLVRAVICA